MIPLVASRIFPKSALISSLLIASVLVVQAHPHAWNDLQLQIVNTYPGNLKINAKDYGNIPNLPNIKATPGHTPIYGFIFTMTLDVISSAPVVVDMRRGRIADTWQEIATNLVMANYFTKVYINNKTPVHFAQAISMIDISINKKNALVLKYFAPFTKPIVLTAQDVVKLQTYDSTYWIDMSYRHPQSDISFSNPNSINHCSYKLENARPSSSLVSYASALPPDQNPNDPNLGQYFAQTIYFGCPLDH